MKKTRALKVSQPLTNFYVVVLKANELLKIAFSEPLTYISDTGELKGNQRIINHSRLKQIGKYIDTVEMTFPNSIILSVNYNEDGSLITNHEKRWKIIENQDETFLEFNPNIKSASIIDGQHRLNGFKYSELEERRDTDLVCSIFFDLPNPYQAYLFATINGNQKRVDKSLALEQFGYFVAKEESSAWTPEKLAANITRKMNFNKGSPLCNKIN